MTRQINLRHYQRPKRIEKSRFGFDSIRLNLYIVENVDFRSFVVFIACVYRNDKLTLFFFGTAFLHCAGGINLFPKDQVQEQKKDKTRYI